MQNITALAEKNKIVFSGVTGLDLDATLHCGQAFRWSQKTEDGFASVVCGRRVFADTDGDSLIIKGEGVENDVEAFRRYFDLGRDYDEIKNLLSTDLVMRKAITYSPGIRILNQDPWEALGSFIFSSNNNIARISGMIEKFCALFGKPAAGGGYCFPSVERVAGLDRADLAPLKCGYRDEYILDAARRIASGLLSLDDVAAAPLGDAREMLMSIRGVGPKVADCALLFGFGRVDAFPADVHINRVMRNCFPNGLPEYARPYAGIAQQYLFHWARTGEHAMV